MQVLRVGREAIGSRSSERRRVPRRLANLVQNLRRRTSRVWFVTWSYVRRIGPLLFANIRDGAMADSFIAENEKLGLRAVRWLAVVLCR